MTEARLLALALLAGAGLATGCGSKTEPVLARPERFGVLRDLVLYERPAAQGGPFFLDRFESTNADWHAFLSARGVRASRPVQELWGGDEPKGARRSTPVTRVTFDEARAFAAWRLLRLVRADEWLHAVRAGGRSPFPWGSEAEPVRGNTGDLGLLEVRPVGSFESGRDALGVYDLLGNVGEWSLGVPAEAWTDLASLGAARAPALRTWFGAAPLPGFVFLAQHPRTPRLVLGGHYAAPGVVVRGQSPSLEREPWAWPRGPQEWGDSTGVRLATSPGEVLAALCALPDRLGPDAEEAVRAFLAQAPHRRVLAAAWTKDFAPATSGAVAALVRAELER